MLINCYGFNSVNVGKDDRTLQPYRFFEENNITYVIFDDYTEGVIHKIDKSVSGQITITWSYGPVANRASLTYIPLNHVMEV